MPKKFNSIQDAEDYLKNLPLNAIITLAAELLYNSQSNAKNAKITITEEQFNQFFRIVGIKESGEKETRGRKRKEQ